MCNDTLCDAAATHFPIFVSRRVRPYVIRFNDGCRSPRSMIQHCLGIPMWSLSQNMGHPAKRLGGPCLIKFSAPNTYEHILFILKLNIECVNNYATITSYIIFNLNPFTNFSNHFKYILFWIIGLGNLVLISENQIFQ